MLMIIYLILQMVKDGETYFLIIEAEPPTQVLVEQVRIPLALSIPAGIPILDYSQSEPSWVYLSAQ